VDTGSRKENASKQESTALVLNQSCRAFSSKQQTSRKVRSSLAARHFFQTVYPARSLLRCGLDTVCSISQNIQTTAVPRPTTTPRNTNVKAGAVSMFSIPDVMQAAYQQTKRGLGDKTPGPPKSSL
jgi:hypothetical protein